jgi:hypothetical protein
VVETLEHRGDIRIPANERPVRHRRSLPRPGEG